MLTICTPLDGEVTLARLDDLASYEQVVGIWADPRRGSSEVEAAVQAEKHASPGSASPSIEPRLGRVLNAVGEALFSLAELERQRSPMTPMPRFLDPRNSERVPEYSEQASRVLMRNAARARQLAEGYKKIVDLQPVPPPQWVIAAGSRVGDLWAEILEQAFAANPMAGVTDPKLIAMYKDAMRQATAPWRAVARSAFETCLGYSVRYQYSDRWSRHCEAWLVEQFPDEYQPTVDFFFVGKWRAPDRFPGWVPSHRLTRD